MTGPSHTVIQSNPVDVNGFHGPEHRAHIVTVALKHYAQHVIGLRGDFKAAGAFEQAEHLNDHAGYVMALAREVRIEGEQVIL